MAPLRLILVAVWCLVWAERGASRDHDLMGDYCAKSSVGGQCCDGRQDDCSHPILGTRCYCDQFCNRTHSSDCCPDYPEVCLGLPPPAPSEKCYIDGKYYNKGEIIRVNCNDCLCDKKNGVMEIDCGRGAKPCLVELELVDSVNRDRSAGWKAANYSKFWGRTLEEGRTRLLGTNSPVKKVTQMKPLRQQFDPSELPGEFDARRRWRGKIGEPLDQGWCAASWAFSTVGVASDRISIMTRNPKNDRLSPQHLLSCNNRNQNGCHGGNLSRAWTFIRKFGLVAERCYPWTGDVGRCQLGKSQTASEVKCLSNPRTKASLLRIGPVYKVTTVEGIMWEIMNNGPVQATLQVQPDFYLYTTGVYKCSSPYSHKSKGYHSVRIVGWGEETTRQGVIPYWIAANSWGLDWGEGGYFRIRRGTDECKIEEFVLAAWASQFSKKRTLRDVLGVV